MAQAILSGIIFGICAAIMIGIGIAQRRSKQPVGFYSGETPPKATELSDVQAWNRKHGTMWILYGLGLCLAWLCGILLGDTLWVLLPISAFSLLPIPLMILYHHHLLRRYSISPQNEDSRSNPKRK